MTIRTFQPGDDLAQVSIYNEAAAEFPGFKPATLDEIRRRCKAADFDPTSHFFAIANNRPVGYATFHPEQGRVSYPWCRKGHEQEAEALFQHMLQEMKQRGLKTAWSAYRTDWVAVRDFFLQHEFPQKREVINWVIDLVQMPTPAARPALPIEQLQHEHLEEIARLCPGLLRLTDQTALERYFFNNPLFPPQSLFVLRSRSQGNPVALGIVVANPTYAHPRKVDASMPCFRLGAFGTEGYGVKRINGLFSVLIGDTRDVNMLALDLLGYAANKLEQTKVETLAAQSPSDAPHLTRFYKQYFSRQGSFPVFERIL